MSSVMFLVQTIENHQKGIPLTKAFPASGSHSGIISRNIRAIQ